MCVHPTDHAPANTQMIIIIIEYNYISQLWCLMCAVLAHETQPRLPNPWFQGQPGLRGFKVRPCLKTNKQITKTAINEISEKYPVPFSPLVKGQPHLLAQTSRWLQTHLFCVQSVMCSLYSVEQRWKTLSVQGQTVNAFNFMGHTLSVPITHSAVVTIKQPR